MSDPEPLNDVSGASSLELPIDDEWRERVLRRMKAMGHDQYTLAAHLGCSQGNVSQTLSLKGKRKQKTSSFAHAISLAVGEALPPIAVGMLVGEAAGNDPSFRSIMDGLASVYGVRVPK